jgi:hypothetical protein
MGTRAKNEEKQAPKKGDGDDACGGARTESHQSRTAVPVGSETAHSPKYAQCQDGEGRTTDERASVAFGVRRFEIIRKFESDNGAFS